MKTTINKIFAYTETTISLVYRRFLSLPRKSKTIFSVGIIIVAAMLARSLSTDPDTTSLASDTRKEVSIIRAGDVGSESNSLPLLGTVTSQSEATIRSESSGRLTRVYRKLGDYVQAGQVLAEFENSGERASLLQAEGSYEAAKAARDIALISGGTTKASTVDVKVAAKNTLSQVYNIFEDVIRIKADPSFTNPREDDATLTITVPDQALVSKLENTRKSIEGILTTRAAYIKTLDASFDLTTELSRATNDAEQIKLFLDDLALAYNKAVPSENFTQSQLDANKSLIATAKTQVNGAISSLIASKTALTNSISQEAIASKTTDTGSSMGTADAQVKQALGAYNGALSRLEKTIIRSPLSGTLNSLSIQTGDFVTAFTEIGVVSNNGALEVLAYVSEDEVKRIIPGSKVSLGGTKEGVITRVASAIDPSTKKIEVRIAITKTDNSLVNGQSVTAFILSATTTKKSPTKQDTITVPLTALKMTPTGPLVFEVNASSTLIAIPVQIGALLGDRIQIISGISPDTLIVRDARGLKASTTVIIKQ